MFLQTSITRRFRSIFNCIRSKIQIHSYRHQSYLNFEIRFGFKLREFSLRLKFQNYNGMVILVCALLLCRIVLGLFFSEISFIICKGDKGRGFISLFLAGCFEAREVNYNAKNLKGLLLSGLNSPTPWNLFLWATRSCSADLSR